VEITVDLPNDLIQRPNPAREALEALAIAGYRTGKLSAHQAGSLLGFTSRFQFEGFSRRETSSTMRMARKIYLMT
jgi:hypothetical protein